MKRETTIKTIKFLFVIYCIGLFFILFMFRNRGNTFNLSVLSKEHFEMINIIPFRTIFAFIDRMKNSTINTSIVVVNLCVNLFMFTPMGMALPVLFNNKFNKLWKTLLFVSVLVLFVEIIQFITFCGSADIDDLILNSLGCMFGYGIINIKAVRKGLKLDN